MFPEAVIVLILVVLLLVWLRRKGPARGRQRIQVDGEWRSYTIDRPTGSQPTKLLLCFHGALGHPRRLREHTGIREAALRRGYTVVFPEAPGGWFDARTERGASRRDRRFVEVLLGQLHRTEGRGLAAFALGVSNGGMFVQRLAMEEPQQFAAFATLLASVPVAALRAAPSGPPAPIALVFGRNDRIVPWAGGVLAMGRRPGIVAPAETTLDYWLRRNRSRKEPIVRRIGDGAPAVEIRDYPALPMGAPVCFVGIDGWGHRWPRWAGDADGTGGFDIADVIFEFFGDLSAAGPAAEAGAIRIRL